ncbi:3-hydroxyacyl-CoA dehydrogenase [Acrasis kona]|uniref:3-hydroxyacyl-CoA dehydrogenase type-2 n=1 Tax=Acrasis kona TaxID=1008807 RepID=A0AAW2YK62_9EUKA
MHISGRTIIVTGAASGLGEATVRRMHDEGAHVVIVDFDEKRGKLLEESLHDTLFIKCDVTCEKSVQNVIDKTVEKYGAIHAVVNCAGIGSASRVVSSKGEPYPLELFKKVMDVNVNGTFNVLRLAARQMLKQAPVTDDGERGVIINTASVAAYEGQIGQAAYSASKGAVVSMALPIAREFSKTGIRVNTIAPGLFETPMFNLLPEKARTSLSKQVPFPNRFGKPEEYADLVNFMITNGMINGECVRLDGCIRMSSL